MENEEEKRNQGDRASLLHETIRMHELSTKGHRLSSVFALSSYCLFGSGTVVALNNLCINNLDIIATCIKTAQNPFFLACLGGASASYIIANKVSKKSKFFESLAYSSLNKLRKYLNKHELAELNQANKCRSTANQASDRGTIAGQCTYFFAGATVATALINDWEKYADTLTFAIKAMSDPAVFGFTSGAFVAYLITKYFLDDAEFYSSIADKHLQSLEGQPDTPSQG